MSALALAPEALDGIRAAQDALEQEAERLQATGDPTAPGMAAQASAVKALHRLMVDLFLKVQAQQEATDKAIQEGRKPWTRDEMRLLITQIDRTLLHRWTQFNRVAVAIGAAVVVAFGLGCGVAGWWAHGAAPALAGVRAGSTQCQDRPDGSRLCWIPVFDRVPPAK